MTEVLAAVRGLAIFVDERVSPLDDTTDATQLEDEWLRAARRAERGKGALMRGRYTGQGRGRAATATTPAGQLFFFDTRA